MNTNPRNRYISLTQAPKHIKESNSNQEISTKYRSILRVLRVTAKYLESIKAELRNSVEDEYVNKQYSPHSQSELKYVKIKLEW